MTFILQLNRGTYRVLQKILFIYFSGTAILTFFVLPAVGIYPAVLALNLNASESAALTFEPSLWYYHKPHNAFA